MEIRNEIKVLEKVNGKSAESVTTCRGHPEIVSSIGVRICIDFPAEERGGEWEYMQV